MYIAPLNYDRFFKKVFSDTMIAKRFLEDFFEKDIETIDLLPPKKKITDDARAVEFDYRCKIDGQFVIVDMQQWYKTDVVKRFYLYHALNTALQLEEIPMKDLPIQHDGKKREALDYNKIDPVVTLIWMADDAMNFTEDFVSFILTPEILVKFVRDEVLWTEGQFSELKEKRDEVLKVADNKARKLSFLPENRLIYALQKNIVNNQKYSKYLAWFEFAEKSKNKNNTEADFEEFAKDKVFAEIIRRLNRESLQTDDFQYIEDYDLHVERLKQYDSSLIDAKMDDRIEEIKIELRETMREEVKEAVREEVKEAVREEVKEAVREEVKEAVREEVKEALKEESKLGIAENCLLNNLSIEQTALITELTIEKVKELAEKLGL